MPKRSRKAESSQPKAEPIDRIAPWVKTKRSKRTLQQRKTYLRSFTGIFALDEWNGTYVWCQLCREYIKLEDRKKSNKHGGYYAKNAEKHISSDVHCCNLRTWEMVQYRRIAIPIYSLLSVESEFEEHRDKWPMALDKAILPILTFTEALARLIALEMLSASPTPEVA
ncbi:hypothetical protein FA15DRAFT_710208 [Coprinopsis marcescibilis]|uniref:Uncharacterized protein n=1 Tax=Coprinopsis marcescibilis TaxID=230819 RepID=A0A5C3KDP6_COPMA|nr:hypothetical protein FA15DRAFT_710208 [Coprinopsis marcescibilis]